MTKREWVIGGLIILIIILILGSMPGSGGSRTYKEIADEYTLQCIQSKGNGGWRGSSGVTLENYCGLSGVVKARQEMCAAHPEEC